MKAPGLQVIRRIQALQEIEIRTEKQDLRVLIRLAQCQFLITIQRQKKGHVLTQEIVSR